MAAKSMKRLATLKILVLAIYCTLKVVSWANGLAGAQGAAHFVRADRPILAASFALPVAGTAAAGARDPDAPQFTFGRAGTAYETHYPDLRAVDFAGLNYWVSGIGAGFSIPLREFIPPGRHGPSHHGVGFEWAEFRGVRVCEASVLAAPRAVVRLRYTSGAGSSTCDEIVQVFDLRDGRLAALHEIVYACAPGGTYAVDCNTGTITATATAWLDSDPHCCPSARDTAVFSFLGEEPRLVSWTRVAVRDQTNPVK